MGNQSNWQPIQNLPIIANLIDGQSSDAKEQYVNLLEALSKSHVLNDTIIQRTIHVYTEQLGVSWGFLPIPSKRYIKEYLSKLYWFKRCFFSNITQMRCGFLLRL